MALAIRTGNQGNRIYPGALVSRHARGRLLATLWLCTTLTQVCHLHRLSIPLWNHVGSEPLLRCPCL